MHATQGCAPAISLREKPLGRGACAVLLCIADELFNMDESSPACVPRRAAIPPYHYGTAHWAAAHVLCLAGAVGGACGVLKYEALQHRRLPGQPRAPDWAVSQFLLACLTCSPFGITNWHDAQNR